MLIKRNINGNPYVKNYEFDFSFAQPWGQCSVTMTSVIGHLNGLDFEQRYKKWQSCRPGELFDAPVIESVDPVGPVSHIWAFIDVDMPQG